MRFGIFVLVLAVTAAVPGMGTAQSSGIASATPVNVSTGTPNTFTIKQQIIAQQQAEIERALTQLNLCISTASLDVVLTDPSGQINRVPQTDIINCRRALNSLQRRLVTLARSAEQLSRDARAQSAALQTQERLAELQQNLRAMRQSIFAASQNSGLSD
ncbi:MAG: hypothetical protein V1792_21380 [Pseudomonadota bacterium]